MNKAQISPPLEYIFVAGRVPKLSALELKAVFNFENLRLLKLASSLLAVKVQEELSREDFYRLGSVRKFGQVIATFHSQQELDFKIIETYIGERNTLGISSLTKKFSALNFGKLAKKMGLVRRFVIGAKGQLLTDAQSKGLKKCLELLVFEEGGELKLVVIEAVQDIDAFRHRDRDLPVADPIRGMLPTKLARTMVNLANLNESDELFDPFCGVGRVLLEAVDLGYPVQGSDIDPIAVEATRKNLQWFKEQDYKLAIADVANLSNLDLVKVGAIVTEPFIGPPQRSQVSLSHAEQIFTEVLPLYVSLFSEASKLPKLKCLVVVFPLINNRSLLEILIDKLPKNRYDLFDSVNVIRPNQFIGRCIGIFKTLD